MTIPSRFCHYRQFSTAFSIPVPLAPSCCVSTCICRIKNSDTSHTSVFAGLRRLLRLARWLDTRPEYKIFLSQVCRPDCEHPLYGTILEQHLRTTRYAIPNHGNNSFAKDIVSQYRQLGNAINSEHGIYPLTHLSGQSHHGTYASKKKFSASDVLTALFCGIRHIRWIQSLEKKNIAALKEEHTVSEELMHSINEKIFVLNTSEFSNIKEGTFLISHPLANGIWKETVILITQRARTHFEGIILNKHPGRMSSPLSADIISEFMSHLRIMLNSDDKSMHSLTSRAARDLVSMIERPPGTISDQFRNRVSASRECQTDLRRAWRRCAWFGGPIPDVLTLRRGIPEDSLRVIIPGILSLGWKRTDIDYPSYLYNGSRRAIRHSRKRNEYQNCDSHKHPIYLNSSLKKEIADTEQIRHFLGVTGWEIGQLQQELKEGSWIPFRTTDSNIIDKIVWDTNETLFVWKNLLSVISKDLYKSALLPATVYSAAVPSEEKKFSRLSSLLASILRNQHQGNVILESSVTDPQNDINQWNKSDESEVLWVADDIDDDTDDDDDDDETKEDK